MEPANKGVGSDGGILSSNEKYKLRSEVSTLTLGERESGHSNISPEKTGMRDQGIAGLDLLADSGGAQKAANPHY